VVENFRKNKMAEKTKTNENHLEREYIIPLRARWKIVPTYKRANKAVKTIKEFLVKHMKIRDRDLNKIKLDKYLNETIWARGIKHPPSKIKVKAIKDGDIVRVEVADLHETLKFKKLREEKVKAKGEVTKKKAKVEEKAPETQEAENKEKKEEVKEDKASTIEAGKAFEKEEAKKAKHETKVKSPKEQKNMKVSYNKASQGQ
jgi:large subunit ribosomal protein L31e